MKNFIERYILLIFIVIVMGLVFYHSGSFFKNRESQGPEDEYERIMAYSVQCYSTMGAYPPNLEYLEENFNLILKRDKYNYFYDSFASNVRPDVIVTMKPQSSGTVDEPLDLSR